MNPRAIVSGVVGAFCLALTGCQGEIGGVDVADAAVSPDVVVLPDTPGVDAPAADVESPEATARRVAAETARRVITAVAGRQVTTLEEGAYGLASWEEVTRNRAPRGVTWLYPWGVTLYGMLRASDASGDARWRDYVLRHNAIVGRYYQYLRAVNDAWGATHRAEVDRMIHESPIAGPFLLVSLDNCGAMSAQMMEGVLRSGDTITPEQETLLGSVADYISMGQSRLPDGTLWRPEQSRTLWIDDLYMSCPFLVRWAQHTGEARYLDDAARQVALFAGRQQDTDGLWYHANFIGDMQRSPYKWGRANGWAMVATVEVLSALPDDHPLRPALLQILRAHIAGVARLQAPSGRWHQVLDHAELWEETSCTAMFTYSIARAVRRGWVDAAMLPVVLRGLQGMAANVAADGSIQQTCAGTGIGTDLAYYASRPRPLNDIHGPGPVLLAASEALAAVSE